MGSRAGAGTIAVGYLTAQGVVAIGEAIVVVVHSVLTVFLGGRIWFLVRGAVCVVLARGFSTAVFCVGTVGQAVSVIVLAVVTDLGSVATPAVSTTAVAVSATAVAVSARSTCASARGSWEPVETSSTRCGTQPDTSSRPLTKLKPLAIGTHLPWNTATTGGLSADSTE